MSAMEGLGRVFNVVPIAAGQGISMKGGAGITFVTTGSDTFTLTTAATFSGTYNNTGLTNLAGLVNVYKNAQTNGTAAWVLDNTLITNNTIVTTVATAFYISDVVLPDGRAYVKLAASSGGLVTAILHDLVAKRTPPNLAILGA